MDTNTLLTILFGLITVTSILLAIYYQRNNKQLLQKNFKLHKERYSYSFGDIQQGVLDLGITLEKEGFTPDIILTVTGSGAIVSSLYMKLFRKRVPFYLIMIEDMNDPWKYTPQGYDTYKVTRWRIHIPKSILKVNKDKKILILDSTFVTGSTIKKVIEHLKDNGLNNIKFACLLRIKPTTELMFNPDYCYFENPTPEFYYPWGKGS